MIETLTRLKAKIETKIVVEAGRIKRTRMSLVERF
ncbi:MAG: hypothetical protein K0R25_156 [Rickettsiaceae bacterium]|jgi:hypothetical protein|nr:hypothetical protein [Rickettsiaceae bacterium]